MNRRSLPMLFLAVTVLASVAAATGFTAAAPGLEE